MGQVDLCTLVADGASADEPAEQGGPLMGSGPTLGRPLSIVRDPRDPNRLYVLSAGYQVQIVMVDLRRGDRYLVSK